MRIIRKKMEQKKGKMLAHSAKKTPHKHKLDPKRKGIHHQRLLASDLLSPCGDGAQTAVPGNIFTAVETGNFEAVRGFVEAARDPGNAINSKGPLYLTALELAVLLHHKTITKYFLQHGGTESDQCEAIIERLKEEVRNNLNDDRQENAEQPVWERRRRSIRRVMLGWDQLKRPDKPKLFVEPITPDSVMVEIVVRESASSIITKLRVQWSNSPIFDVFNERIIAANPQNLKFIIPKLDPNCRYFFRAYAGNIKDWSSLSSFSLCCASWRKSDAGDANRELDNLHAKLQSICDVDGKDEKVQSKKKGGIHLLFTTATTKFVRSLKRGIYLAFVFYSREKNVFLVDESIPCVEVCDSSANLSPIDFHWLLKISRSWFNIRGLRLRDRDSWDMRRKLIHALRNVQEELGVLDLGQLHHREVQVDDAVVLTFLKCEEVAPSILSGKWTSLDKVKKQHFLAPTLVEEMIKNYESTSSPLQRGLYLAYLTTKTSLNSLYVLTSRLNILPHAKIRENPYVCGEEWEIITENKVAAKSYLTELQLKFLQDLQRAVTDLLKVTHHVTGDLQFFAQEIFEINENVSLLIVLPKGEKFCEVVSDDSSLRNAPGPFLPLKIFELLNLSVYQPQMARKHFELSCTLELELHLAAQQTREAFSADEIAAAKQRLRQLQQIADACKELWRRLNWINNLITTAQGAAVAGKGVSEEPPTLRQVLEFKRASTTDGTTDRTPKIKVRHHHKSSPKHHFHNHSYTSSLDSSALAKKVEDLRANVQNVRLLEAPPPETSILQVFAAYDTGLPSGTSLKLRVTLKTTAREVIDLVVKQLNMAVVLKGKEGPIYDSQELQNFCLVAIIGARERCLRDDFRPLQLQNPWKKGTLYVRQKHDLLAAIEHSTHQTSI